MGGGGPAAVVGVGDVAPLSIGVVERKWQLVLVVVWKV